MTHIKTGYIYLLDGITPVTALKPLNRSKTVFSIELPNRGVETVGAERLHPQKSSLETIDLDIERTYMNGY